MSDSEIIEILHHTRRIGLVGASDNPVRPAWQVMKYLLEQGYEVIPINPKLAGKKLLGQQAYANLTEIAGGVDLVDVFRHPSAVPAITVEAIETGAKYLWLQKGIIDPLSALTARQAGLIVVMDRCPKIEIPRLFDQIR